MLVGRYSRSHLVTLVERHSRYLLVLPLADAKTATVLGALTTAFAQLPPLMRCSLTWDRGIEMIRHSDFSAASAVPVYFCDGYCPWQLPLAARQRREHQRPAPPVLPKKSDLSLITAEALLSAVDQLNHRPRRALAWQSSQEVFWRAVVAMTA